MSPSLDSAGIAGLFDLSGRLAVVTGAASGLGRAIAQGLSVFGASVALIDVDREGLAAAAAEIGGGGGTARVYEADARDEAAMASAAAAIENELGTPQILMNVAGISRWAQTDQADLPGWRDVIDVNLVGVFIGCKTFGSLMVAARCGSIVNMASIAAFGSVGTGNTSYSASKAGVVGLTHELAVEWAPSGVRVNALAPAWFDTPMVQRGRELRGVGVEYYTSRVPMGRMGEPWEIVGPAVFLASDGSSMVTGHTLAVDGGFLSW